MRHYLFLSLLITGILLAPAIGLADWTAPRYPPPTCPAGDTGCDAPVNVSSVNQTKLGALVTSGFRSMLDLFVDGKLGIGTTQPSVTVDIVKNNSGEGPRVSLNTTDTTANQWSAFQFASGSTFKGGLLRRKSNDNIEIFGAGNNNPSLIVEPNTGDIGIKTQNPAATLDVNGNICYVNNGTRTCLGSDSSGTPTPGDGVGDDFLYTTWDGCIVGGGCLIRSGDPGPTAMPVLGVLNMGTWRMTCPAGYHVINGGADCKPPIPISGATKISSLTSSWPASETSWEVQCTSFFLSYLGWFTDPTFDAIKKASITCAK